jgi:glycosyltransferase involved in cell wall biosynthesis
VSRPVFSVIIPAYNQAEFIAQTIQSLLDQTFSNFEVIVVNDCSSDHTNEVVAQFDDPRVRCIVHSQNKGLPASRNTGIRASSGDFIALLDSDDYFHPQKLEQHFRFYQEHPEISITYNPRFELHYSSDKIRDIYRPPLTAGLRDFVLGFPFSPSDMVIRKEVIEQGYLFGDQYVCGGEDMDYPCRLALAGFRFASVDKVLNFRRYHSGRKKKKLRCRVGDYTKALESILLDPRCPQEIQALRKQGFANHYVEVASWALAQGEYELAEQVLREILLCDPAINTGKPSRLHQALFQYSIRDETSGHEQVMQTMFQGLPADLACPPDLFCWFTARGYLLRGSRAIIWGDDEAGEGHFRKAKELQAEVEPSYLNMLSAQLLSFELEFGQQAAQAALKKLLVQLELTGGPRCARYLDGRVNIEQAFTNFRSGRYPSVPRDVSRAVRADPAYLLNRGVLSITLRSIFKRVREQPRG